MILLGLLLLLLGAGIGIARVDFPELAWRHAIGAEPLSRVRG